MCHWLRWWTHGLRGPSRPEVADAIVQRAGRHGLDLGRCHDRLGRGGAFALNQLDELLALFGLDGAQLVLCVDAVLAGQCEQVFALHAQLARQCKNPNLVVSQAQLPW
jgi:hypothetical protein